MSINIAKAVQYTPCLYNGSVQKLKRVEVIMELPDWDNR